MPVIRWSWQHFELATQFYEISVMPSSAFRYQLFLTRVAHFRQSLGARETSRSCICDMDFPIGKIMPWDLRKATAKAERHVGRTVLSGALACPNPNKNAGFFSLAGVSLHAESKIANSIARGCNNRPPENASKFPKTQKAADCSFSFFLMIHRQIIMKMAVLPAGPGKEAKVVFR